MIAPPGKPKTSLTPRCSRERRIAPEPVSTSGTLRALLGVGGASADITEFLASCTRMVVRDCESARSGGRLPRDRTLRGGVDELGVLCENATGIARGKWSPAFTAGCQLGLVDE